MKNKWQQIKLGDVCTPRKGFTYKSEDYSDKNDGVVFITLKCIAKGGGFNTEGIKYIKKSEKTEKLRTGDLIIANTDLTRAGDVIGAPLFVPKLNFEDEYVYSMDISKLVVDNSKLNQKYLYQYLLYSQVRNYMRSISSGSTVLHLKLKLVDKLSIPLPSMDVQQKIADILFTIDEALQKTDQVIQKTEELKRGLMDDLLTKGIAHTKFKKTKLGEIPEAWEIVKLEEIASVERGKFSHRPRNDPKFYGGDIPFIQTGDVVNSNGRVKSFTQTLNERGLNVSRIFPKGTIVITIAANIGDTAILDFDSCFPDSLVGIQPKPEVDAIYLEYFLRSRKPYLNSIATQSAQKNINLAKLNPLPIAIPPITEQRKIAEILSMLDAKINQESIQKASLELLKNGLMNDIFSQKVAIN